ncbi:hypothetical protein IM538_06310 [Cytobacillus suaedae]|nr:hypothetical protein IM538_06310 [Cytobacillus suaedae]
MLLNDLLYKMIWDLERAEMEQNQRFMVKHDYLLQEPEQTSTPKGFGQKLKYLLF